MLTPLALTRDQVITYHLPRIPIKESDVRKAGFEERYGAGAVELDALEALYPGVLADLVRDAIAPYRDMTLAERFEEVAAEALEVADQFWEAQMDAALQAELAPLQERMETLRHAVEVAMWRFHPTLPTRPEADTEPVDEETWLFDGQRDYLCQLAIYKARKHGQDADEPTA